MVMVSIVDAVNRVALGRGPGFALFILRPIKQFYLEKVKDKWPYIKFSYHRSSVQKVIIKCHL